MNLDLTKYHDLLGKWNRSDLNALNLSRGHINIGPCTLKIMVDKKWEKQMEQMLFRMHDLVHKIYFLAAR